LELVEALTLLIYFNPGIDCYIGEDFILCLKSKLLSKFAAGLGTHDIMSLFLCDILSELLHSVIEDSEAADSTALEVSVVVVSDRYNLF